MTDSQAKESFFNNKVYTLWVQGCVDVTSNFLQEKLHLGILKALWSNPFKKRKNGIKKLLAENCGLIQDENDKNSTFCPFFSKELSDGTLQYFSSTKHTTLCQTYFFYTTNFGSSYYCLQIVIKKICKRMLNIL